MVERSIILARIRRQQIEEAAGQYWRSEAQLQALLDRNALSSERLLFGLVKDDRTWTLFFENQIIASVGDRVALLDIQTVGDAIHDFFFQHRKEIDVDEIPVGGGAKIWLVSTEMAYKVLNLINLLTDQ